MAENGYTTIFQPGNEGVTIHKKGTLTIMTSEPPMLQGCKKKGAKLWTVSAAATDNECKKVANVYGIPSINQTIKYLHAAAGYPVEDTWVKAINAGNYTTWPGLTATVARKHFPESNKTQKEHMKCQGQGVRSTRTLQTIMEDDKEHITPNSGESPDSKPKKMRDMYIKIHNTSKTMHTDQPGQLPATSSNRNQYIMVLVKVDRNYINAKPIKNKSAGSMVKAYIELWTRLTAKGVI